MRGARSLIWYLWKREPLISMTIQETRSTSWSQTTPLGFGGRADMDQTSPYSGTTGAPFFKVTIPALTLMFGLFGTGGNYTDDIHKQRTAGLFFPSEDREPRVNASA